MQIGLLWYESGGSSGSELVFRICRAVKDYQECFGEWPEVCLMSGVEDFSDDIEDKKYTEIPCKIGFDARVPDGYFWLGANRMITE